MFPLPRRLLLGALATGLGLAGAPATVPAAAQSPAPPNILIILTDDQRATDTMQVLPKTLRLFADEGTTFTNAYATTPVCCPSRASIVTGQFAHNTNVRTNQDQALLNHETTIERYLNERGYQTALVGKWLNNWPITQNPPHFDRWAVMQPDYFDAEFNIDGTVETMDGYSTDVTADITVDLIKDFEATDASPWFLHVNPYAPHGPWTPGPAYQNADVGTWDGNPAVFEFDKSDKPQYVKAAQNTIENGRLDREGQLRTLLSVDDLVKQIFDAIDASGEQNTLAFFLSDNGFFWSEHGLTSKNQPYAQAMQIPFFARWPGRIAAGDRDRRFVANIDIAPTIMNAAGIAPDGRFPMDGQSLLEPAARRKLLLESWASGSRGPWASILTASYQYTEYYLQNATEVKFREYYDPVADPWQLTNLLGDGVPRNDPFIGALAAELAEARRCAGTECAALFQRPGVPSVCPGARGEFGHHLVGSDGNDRITGISGRDVICGRDGKDIIKGAGARDLLVGGNGNDLILGGPGNDMLIGGPWRDVCRGGPGRDRYRSCEVIQDPGGKNR
jgi:arylsulfatase A-like enzyme